MGAFSLPNNLRYVVMVKCEKTRLNRIGWTTLPGYHKTEADADAARDAYNNEHRGVETQVSQCLV